MGKKNKGFNTPFANVQLELPEQPEAPEPEARRIEQPEEPADDDEVFARAMTGVAPLGSVERMEPQKQLEIARRNDDALALAELESFVRGEGPFSLEDSGEIVSGRAPGVSHEVLSRLSHGHFSFRRHMDLHGFSRDEAHLELGRFIADARRNNERCVLVITGRGKSSPGGLSVLRETTPRWLSRAPIRAHVLAFCTAQRVDGGPGAFYVLLRRPGVKPFGAPT